MTTILAASSPDALRAALAKYPQTATVEAEYGNTVVEGSVLTLAHHAPAWAHNASPCTRKSQFEFVQAIGLSHVDLDSVGGTLALLGTKPGPDSFWKLAGLVDVKGAHRLAECQKVAEATNQDVRCLRAYWAWAKTEGGRVVVPRDGTVIDVTAQIEAHRLTLQYLLLAEPHSSTVLEYIEGLFAAGDAFAKNEAKANADSFVQMDRGVITRVGPDFANHLYATPEGEPGLAVVHFDTKKGCITISFADAPTLDEGARGIVQLLWGKEAGGQVGIAGSPRDRRMSLGDFLEAATSVRFYLGAEKITRLAKAAVDGATAAVS